MCGIVFICNGPAACNSHQQATAPLTVQAFADSLAARGPDFSGEVQVPLEWGGSLSFASSLLQLRGRRPTASPHTDEAGNILLFNGEIFGGLQVPEGCNDGEVLLRNLGGQRANPVTVLSRLRGPWALAYWQAAAQTLWFGRDAIGRRSLLVHRPNPHCPSFCLASVAASATGSAACSGQGSPAASTAATDSSAEPPQPSPPLPASSLEPAEAWQELEPGVYSMCFGDSRLLEGRVAHEMVRHAWSEPVMATIAAYDRPRHLVPEEAHPEPAAQEAAQERVLQALQSAVDVRCRCIEAPHGTWDAGGGMDDGLAPAPVLVLFSGGVDSTLLAALAHRALPEQAPIDLATICFDGGRSPDRQSALDAFEELAAFAPSREWRLIEVAGSLADVDAHRAHLLDLLHPAATIMDLNIGAALWLAAHAEGPMRLHAPSARRAQPNDGSSAGSRRCAGQQGAHGQDTAAAGHASGSGGCGPPSEARSPSAADRRGCRRDGGGGGGAAAAADGGESAAKAYWGGGARYRSAARVVLLGHGADELCGGYGRYRTRFREQGWEGLSAELALDMGRLWRRNLGRDDRLIADVSREARHPFLDEGVIAALLGLPLHAVADLRRPPGAGDKLLLRGILAGLGLVRAAARVKRAIQFGTRLSNQQNVRDFGSNRRANVRKAGGLHVEHGADHSASQA